MLKLVVRWEIAVIWKLVNGRMRVIDTHKTNDIYIHSGVIEQGSIKTGDQVQVKIDEPRRQSIKRNHTATHLLQAALRETFGTHIKQQGSLVEEGRLRFDFTHPVGVKPEEMNKIENRLNEFISRKDLVTTEVLALEEAKQKVHWLFLLKNMVRPCGLFLSGITPVNFAAVPMFPRQVRLKP